MKYFTSICLLTAFVFGLNAEPACSQSSARFSNNVYKNNQGDSLLYRQLFPDADTFRRYPLVIFLHGSGERGNDNEAQLKWGVANFATDENMMRHPAFVIAPQCPQNQQWSNFSPDGYEVAIDGLKADGAIDRLDPSNDKDPAIDSNRIYITGLSMGGYGTYDAIERYPSLFAAAVPVCGGGDVSKAPSIAHIPIWIYHGADDPAVSPIYSARYAASADQSGSPSRVYTIS